MQSLYNSVPVRSSPDWVVICTDRDSLHKIQLDQIEKINKTLSNTLTSHSLDSIHDIIMNLFSALPFLLILELASASASAVRVHTQQDRHLLQDSSCALFRVVLTYEPTEDHPNGHEEESWVCEFSEQDNNRSLNGRLVEVVESSAVAAVLANATSGSSMMWMSDAILHSQKSQMSIPENAHVEIRKVDQDRSRSTGTTGTLKTLVVRLTDGDNTPVDASADQLKNDIFDDSPSLKTQMEACSYGKLEIEPFIGETMNEEYISNGVVDVKMDHSMSVSTSACKVVNAAINAAYEQLGSFKDFDLLMFCIPPGKGFPISVGWCNGKYSFYNNEWCGSISTQMHEVGQNIGLASSGSDRTGFMGSGYGDSFDLQMCYNPQKNYQLGWYDDKAETINPLDGVGGREFILNGVSDYNNKNDNALVVLRLDQLDDVQDYYVGFNQAEGINKGTREDKNMVTIVRKEKGGCNEYGESMKVASLMPGDKHVISGFNGKEDVEISFLSLSNGDAKIAVVGGDSDVVTTCEDTKKKKEKFKRKGNGRKKTCKFYAKKKKCDEMVLTGMDDGKYIWEVCEMSCDRCGV